ncbi:MAG TPA: ABC transporter ATP-binding protein [Geminicoccaceae bacterium]|nr:ABC transporter ATP-binding protein [Geminicoccaceae bacterium]
MSTLLQVEDLAVHFRVPYGLVELVSRAPRRVIRAVDGVDLELRRGETLGLVGESGCGKSTLGRAILRLVKATSGRVLFEGKDVLGLDHEGLIGFRRRAQMVFQDPHASLNPKLTVGQALDEALRVHRVCPPAERAERIAALMETVGLAPELAARRPAALSGGQCQRVGIARALALGPELIIADESVSALDVSIQAQVLNLFMRLQSEMRLTMMFISHDLGVVRHLCHRVAVMYLGQIVEAGPTEEVFHRPRHPYTQALLEAIPRMSPDATGPTATLAGEPPSPIALPAGCPFHPRCPRALPVCRRDPGPAQRLVNDVQVRCHLY